MLLPIIVATVLLTGQALQPPIPSAGNVGQAEQQNTKQTDTQSGENVSMSVVVVSPQAVVSVPPQPESGTQTAEHKQPPALQWGAISDWGILGVTLALLVLGYFQWNTAQEAHRHFCIVERAYVTISPEPDGFEISHAVVQVGAGDALHQCRLRMQVTNFGNTPALVTSAAINMVLNRGPMPIVPPYNSTEKIGGFLVKGESIPVLVGFEQSREKIIAFRANELSLWVFGYVDYIDRFDNRHRCGFGRRAHSRGTSSSDRFVVHGLFFDGHPGYNYDRLRERGEGNDWDDAKPS
jgi:hypothetical protein